MHPFFLFSRLSALRIVKQSFAFVCVISVNKKKSKNVLKKIVLLSAGFTEFIIFFSLIKGVYRVCFELSFRDR